MTRDRYTPSGTYYVYSKERNRVLRGTKDPVTGKYPYESPEVIGCHSTEVLDSMMQTGEINSVATFMSMVVLMVVLTYL